MITSITFPLVGPAGEPVDFRRTINGHGVTSLPPMAIDGTAVTLRITLALPGWQPRTVSIASPSSGAGRIDLLGARVDDQEADAILTAVRHVLRLEQDLAGFYAIARSDPALSWVTRGAGRMTRCQTVFEDVVKTICTTNCAWSATVRVVSKLVAELGEPAPDARPGVCEGRAFPTPAAMATADEAFYRDTVRCGYRGAYLRKLAQAVIDRALNLEALGAVTPEVMPDDELAHRLQTLPGVGPYAAAHIMMMLGRSSRLILDSWTRPTYARLIGRDAVSDAEIRERFAPYGPYAGLAFWLTITRDWLDDD